MDQSSKKLIIIIEDSRDEVEYYREVLSGPYETLAFESVKELKDYWRGPIDKKASLIMADLSLVDGHFLDFLKNEPLAESISAECPILIVSAAENEEMLRECFSRGAADYLVKPFPLSELLVKTERVIQSSEAAKGGGKALTPEDMSSYEVMNVKVSGLTNKQIQFLTLFSSNENYIISREQIFEKVWGNAVVHPKTLDVHLYNLRRKIRPYGLAILSKGQGVWQLVNSVQSARV